MRQYDFEGDETLDETLEELCSSPQETQKLKEMASLLCALPRAQSSSSFQAELRASLLEKGQSISGGVDQKKVGFGLLAGIYKYQKKFFPRPFFSAAAVVMAVVALAAFYNHGPIKLGPGGRTPQNPSMVMIVQDEPEQQTTGKESPPSAAGKELKGKLEDNEQVEAETRGDELSITSPDKAGKGDPALQVSPSKEQELGKGGDPGQSVPLEPQDDQDDPLRPAPLFAVEKNLRSIKFAGSINLPPVYYNSTKTETATPAEKVNYAWEPRKIISMMAREASSIGTPSWAREILSNEGFSVREGDLLISNFQETQKGNFAEVFYSSQKSGEPGLKLVLHYEEGKGILGYYYQEQGEIWQPGFYPLLSPSQAFAQVQGVEWYAPSARLDFSFQEVFLTYHDFLVEENAQQKTRRLPAYCFLGRETFHNGGELKLYLPAVP